jgi:hypothetical protein
VSVEVEPRTQAGTLYFDWFYYYIVFVLFLFFITACLDSRIVAMHGHFVLQLTLCFPGHWDV